MPDKKRISLPNTIRLTRAHACEPRSYSEGQIEEIAGHLGPLPAGKILYPARADIPFHILGEELPGMRGMFQAYTQGKEIKMDRKLAFQCCLEAAAGQYRDAKKNKQEYTPSQQLRSLEKIEVACKVLLSVGDLLRWWKFPSLEGDIRNIIASVEEIIPHKKRYLASQKKTGKSRHQRDVALHDLIGELCIIWVRVAGRKFSTGSVSSDGKKVGGPLIHFIDAALKPLGVNKKPNAIRELLRDVRSNPNFKDLI